ncbi:MAG TPA: CvpA family protein [Bryobacteraceae bacterium]|jgi:membrane protein required for colicin V production|nr:CvpA family protein [Bryobacteraceae bacterium]
MNWLDLLLLVLIAGSAAAAFTKGITREVVGILSLIGAVVLAAWFYGTAGGWLEPFVSSRGVANLCGFLIVFFAALLLGALVGALLARLLHLSGLSVMDRLLGLVFGAARGLLFAVCLVMAFMAFTPGTSPPAAVVHSRLAPYVVEAADLMAAIAPHELKNGFRKNYEQVQSKWKDTLKKGI